MKDCIEYERPNTVSGLVAKRKELTKLLGKITAEAERVRTSIKHIDGCIMLFDPSAAFALVDLTGFEVVGIKAATLRAVRLTIGISPADIAERRAGFLV